MTTSRKDEWRWIYGANPVLEAILSKNDITTVWVQKGKKHLRKRLDRVLKASGRNVSVAEVSAQELQKLCRRGDHQGFVAKVAPIANSSLAGLCKDKGDLFVLLLDGVEDPQNLGAIYRVADAGGVDLIFLPAKGSASHQLPSVAKSSAGAVEHVPTVVVGKLKSAVDELRERGFKIYALEGGKKGKKPQELDKKRPIALIVGSEGRGVSTTLAQKADALMSLPMCGKVNSLNVATATAVAVYSVLDGSREKK